MLLTDDVELSETVFIIVGKNSGGGGWERPYLFFEIVDYVVWGHRVSVRYWFKHGGKHVLFNKVECLYWPIIMIF